MTKSITLKPDQSALASLLFIFVSALSSSAQNVERPNEFSIWGGGSFHSAQVAGTADHTKLGIIGLRYARHLTSGNTLMLKYTVDIIPLIVLSFQESLFPSPPGLPSQQGRSAVYSAGFAPVGLQANFRPQHKAQPFIGLSGGSLYFARNIPNQLGKQFNFTADVGGGLQLFYRPQKAITFGYKLHHISNAERGDLNPGFDSNVLYLGFSFFK